MEPKVFWFECRFKKKGGGIALYWCAWLPLDRAGGRVLSPGFYFYGGKV